MGFNELFNNCARQQMMLLGAVDCNFYGAAEAVPTIVVIDRDVEVVSDNGLATEKKIMLSLWREEVGKVRKGYRVLVVATTEEFVVNDIISDDGFIVQVYARG
jgi:hypothetical protein